MWSKVEVEYLEIKQVFPLFKSSLKIENLEIAVEKTQTGTKSLQPNKK